MLIDKMLDFCKETLSSSCKECNHPSGNCSNDCKGDCRNCLDEVHWGPTNGKRVDYDCDRLINSYILKFSSRYKVNIETILSTIDLKNYPCFNILSLGCGEAPDLMAFENLKERKIINYKGCDRNPKWKPIHDFITHYMMRNEDITVVLEQQDVFDMFNSGYEVYEGCNILVVQYLISHLYNTHQSGRIQELYDYIAHSIIPHRISSSPFLIIINDIDSYNKGRNLFYLLLNTLEDCGFNGIANAYSQYANGDLGKTRWGETKKRKGRIEYNYNAPLQSMEGASLVIELR